MISVGIVEDNRDFRNTLSRYLNDAPGYKCVAACGSAEEALKVMPKISPEVVLMDIHLPSMSGMACTRRLKDICPGIQILILTVYEDNERVFGALKAGASGYLLKRTPSDKLLEAITEARLGGAPMTRKIARKVVQYFHQLGVVSPEAAILSRREQETLALLAEGFRYKEIAEKMGISFNTVREYVHSIYRKLHVTSRTEAVVKYQRSATANLSEPRP